MADTPTSTQAIRSLKKAANYTKLAFHEFGPKSYKKGQGALLKVIAKFGENDKINKKTAEKILDWRGKDLRHVARKAEKNGYLTIEDPEFAFTMTLTEKGSEVVRKRMAAEDKVADTILEALTEEEVKQLIAITGKISETCEGLGVDYSLIKERPGRDHCPHKHHHGHGEGHDHPHCHHHGHQGHSKYVFVFKG